MRLLSLLFNLAFPLILIAGLFAQEESDRLEAALSRAGERADTWRSAIASCSEELRADVRFLVEHMPARDLAELDPARIVDTVRQAHEVRARVPWGGDLPEEVFRNDVLPYSHVNESRDDTRRELEERFLERVLDCKSPGEAARRLNETIFGELGVRYSTARKRADQSSRETIDSGLASCTGLSILLADACRACGVPARLTGIASWPDKRGNHTWVEVWDGVDGEGGWHFLGAAEPDPNGLDRAWFTGDAARAVPGSRDHGIWAVSYGATDHLFPLVWSRDQDYVHAVEVTHRYIPRAESSPEPTSRLIVVARGTSGRRLEAPVEVKIEGVEGSQSGVTRGYGTDTNDHLAFEVPRGGRALVRFADGEERRVEIEGETTWVERQIDLDQDELSSMLEEDPGEARQTLWKAYADSFEHAELRADFEVGRVRTEDRESPWLAREVGEKPDGGWPLVIAMHGGGGVPKEFNDSQWQHMFRFYKDHPEVSGYRYLALRAPNDTWNGFYDDAICPLISRLILQQVLCADVDADRVHAIGYSHGGYGAWVIGPKTPDRFAAVHASAAAPSGGESQLANLFALPFTFMCGERDTAYGRIERCRAAEGALSELRGAAWPGAYPAKAELIDGVGHGGLPDRDKMAEMMPLIRDPLPSRLVWRPSDQRVRDYYWISIDAPRDGQQVSTHLEGNHLEITSENVERLVVWLDERMVDLSRDLIVEHGGETRRYELSPGIEAMRESLGRFQDPQRIFTVKLVLEL